MKWDDNDAVAVLKCERCGWTFEHILLRGDDVPDCEECAERGEQANTYVRSSRPYGVSASDAKGSRHNQSEAQE